MKINLAKGSPNTTPKNNRKITTNTVEKQQTAINTVYCTNLSSTAFCVASETEPMYEWLGDLGLTLRFGLEFDRSEWLGTIGGKLNALCRLDINRKVNRDIAIKYITNAEPENIAHKNTWFRIANIKTGQLIPNANLGYIIYHYKNVWSNQSRA